ncbi:MULTISPECIES: SDR family oxidoreductase [Halomonas]|uniref:SDR family oxidoreductase n=1 Tax=Halomonas TaxID=2745 RepID=UPI001C955CD5|nr:MULTISPECIES: SDR family oxidoreductase [Halomonas]MBY6208634.1 SDR family oxidoreductase [Halomonas sp. DP3Y7-2]MBY6227105.1 SDR family oxidoreductase [Halomonas sp. DP3Y7-1]MCA0915146.1 SDR family oxidoreductase [Halomonas denitrificans]
MRVKDKVVLVTGAGAGIGAATAVRLAEEGAKVVVTDINESMARQVAESIGDRALGLKLDVSIGAEVKAVIQQAIEHFGSLHVLVNNAGFGILGTVVDTEEEDWDRLMDVDLKGVYLCSKYAIPEIIRAGGGAIVNVASNIAVVGIKERAAYVASKGGVAALTRAMALDHAKDNIRVNSVAPGVINSSYYEEMMKKVDDPVAFRKGLEARSPLNKMGEPIDIANMILFLASDESGFATGSMFTIDGGFTAG